MTVMAYRDGMLAADRNCSDGHILHGTRTKIFRAAGGEIAAGAGPSENCAAFRQWVEDGRHPGAKPELDEKFCAILVEADGRVTQYDQHLIPFFLEAPYFAEGDGYAVALGAMFMGASAEEAVRAACAHVLGCGGGVDVLRLAVTHEASPAPASQVI